MKKIHLLVVKAFIKPFVVTFFIVMFVLLMLFLFKYVDDLIGKGFAWYVILELMMYASATNVAMALPLAILLSSIMTFGSLGENYELVAIKSAGVSLQKAMIPLILVIMVLAVASFWFSDFMLPKANLKFGSLYYDIREQKPSFLIKEGVFNNSLSGYSIRVDSKGEDGQSLYGLIIYDHTKSDGIADIIRAKEGKMYKSDDDRYLILKLKNGVRYNEEGGNGGYNPRQVLYRTRFKETEQKFDLSSFQMKRTNESAFKNHHAMMNLKQLDHATDSLKHSYDSLLRSNALTFKNYYKQYTQFKGYDTVKASPIVIKDDKAMLSVVPADKRLMVVQYAFDQANAVKNMATERNTQSDDLYKTILRFLLEYQRKFTLAASCIVLFFIGAPLGAIIRKGGLGLPVVTAIIFFLFYHIISTLGEKSAKEGTLSPVTGMWIAIVILAPLGAFLTYKATADSALFDIDQYKQKFLRIFKKKKDVIS